MRRRAFLKSSGLGALAIAAGARAEKAATTDRPNILLVMTDQMFSDCMSCVIGDKYIKTPNIDALAASGARFSRAYSPNPLCVPMRTSMITGCFPHQTGVQNNSDRKLDSAKFRFMGKIFKDAGYETAYFGKWHIPVKTNMTQVHGFETFVGRSAQLDPSPAADFIRKKHNKPFLAVASFLSPHEICEWARKEKLPGGSIGEPPPLEKRPPLRKNFDPPENETDIMTHMRKAYQSWRMGSRLPFPVGNYTEDDWRRHIWGYYRLIERADGFLGSLMKAVKDSGQEENTVVIFISDHGDCHGAHKWNQKTVFYDESTRVPFIISLKGTTPKSVPDVLINTGTDIIPTMCDFAGIKVPTALPGKSMKAAALGNTPDWKRDYVVSQNHMVQCAPVDGKHLKPQGRMVRSDQYKYCVYNEGKRRESLVDMKNDPGEMVNQAENPKFAEALKQHRAYLKEHADRYDDKTALDMLKDVEIKQ